MVCIVTDVNNEHSLQKAGYHQRQAEREKYVCMEKETGTTCTVCCQDVYCTVCIPAQFWSSSQEI